MLQVNNFTLHWSLGLWGHHWHAKKIKSLLPQAAQSVHLLFVPACRSKEWCSSSSSAHSHRTQFSIGNKQLFLSCSNSYLKKHLVTWQQETGRMWKFKQCFKKSHVPAAPETKCESCHHATTLNPTWRQSGNCKQTARAKSRCLRVELSWGSIRKSILIPPFIHSFLTLPSPCHTRRNLPTLRDFSIQSDFTSISCCCCCYDTC